MNRFLSTAIFSCAAILCLGPAASQAQVPQKPPCLRQIDIYSFDPVPGNRSLVVEDRSHRRYRVNFMGICSGLQYKLGLRFKTFSTSNLSCLSRGDQVIRRDPVAPSQCIIRDIQYQTPELDRKDREARPH